MDPKTFEKVAIVGMKTGAIIMMPIGVLMHNNWNTLWFTIPMAYGIVRFTKPYTPKPDAFQRQLHKLKG